MLLVEARLERFMAWFNIYREGGTEAMRGAVGGRGGHFRQEEVLVQRLLLRKEGSGGCEGGLQQSK